MSASMGVTLFYEKVRIVDPASQTDCVGDVLLQDGMLVDFGQNISQQLGGNRKDLRVIDGQHGKLWLTPGWIDIHTHFREPGQEWKEDVASGSAAAVHGGVTTAVCMANTSPAIDHPSICDAVREKAEDAALINLYMFGACSLNLQQEQLAPLGKLANWGVRGFSDDGRVIQNGQFMRRVMEFAKTFDLPVIPHAEDRLIRQNGTMNEGKVCWELGHTGNPAAAEIIMVGRDIELARMTGAHLHLPHVTTAGAVELIRRAKNDGVHVSAEACPHHFRLTEESVRKHGTAAKMAPPLRSEQDRLALVAGLKDGTINCIATDHAPHAPHEKELPFADAPFGILGFQTLLPQSLALAEEAGLTALALIRLVTQAPAEVLGLPHGKLHKNAPAELVLFDPGHTWTFDATENRSKSRNSPWWGSELTGKVLMTLNRGKIVYEA